MKRNLKKLDELIALLGSIEYKRDVPAKNYTSFRIGGCVSLLAEPKNENELNILIEAAKAMDYPYFVFGNGSNLLVQDEPIDAIFIRLGENYSEYSLNGKALYADAGALLCTVARASVNAGFKGLEWAAGIPGSIGGGIAMNAGAYGGELKDVLKTVRLFKSGEIFEHELDPDEMGYRYSAFSFPNAVILGGSFELLPDDGSASILMEEYSRRRRSKQPIDLPSAGSTFKRPEGHFAAKLIEDAGLKGFRIGNAMISEKHAGFVVNMGGASFADVAMLMDEVQERVFAVFGVQLEPEVKLVTEQSLKSLR